MAKAGMEKAKFFVCCVTNSSAPTFLLSFKKSFLNFCSNSACFHCFFAFSLVSFILKSCGKLLPFKTPIKVVSLIERHTLGVVKRLEAERRTAIPQTNHQEWKHGKQIKQTFMIYLIFVFTFISVRKTIPSLSSSSCSLFLSLLLANISIVTSLRQKTTFLCAIEWNVIVCCVSLCQVEIKAMKASKTKDCRCQCWWRVWRTSH